MLTKRTLMLRQLQRCRRSVPGSCAQIAFAYYCGAENMGEFSRDEFTRGVELLGASSVSALRSRMGSLRASFDTTHDDTFRQIYLFAFPWACERGKKIMPLTGAIELWRLLFAGAQVRVPRRGPPGTRSWAPAAGVARDSEPTPAMRSRGAMVCFVAPRSCLCAEARGQGREGSGRAAERRLVS